MKLTRTTEWAIIVALIAYIAFTPGFPIVKQVLATPVGKAAALGVIVYVWKFVSPVIALLLIISFLRCAKWNVWEMFSGAETACTCENPEAIWDSQSKTCKDATGNAAGAVKTCTCANGYAWDGGEKGKKECIPVSGTQPPVPPPAVSPMTPTPGAPTTEGPAAPSVPPMTTPGAAQAALATATATPTTGVQPGAGTSSVPGSV